VKHSNEQWLFEINSQRGYLDFNFKEIWD